MATIEELERRADEIEAAEGQAITELVEQMRDSAVRLPDGSRLALILAREARRLEPWADRVGPGMRLGVHNATNDIAEQQSEDWSDREEAA